MKNSVLPVLERHILMLQYSIMQYFRPKLPEEQTMAIWQNRCCCCF